jgi:hypothetical protein
VKDAEKKGGGEVFDGITAEQIPVVRATKPASRTFSEHSVNIQ